MEGLEGMQTIFTREVLAVQDSGFASAGQGERPDGTGRAKRFSAQQESGGK